MRVAKSTTRLVPIRNVKKLIVVVPARLARMIRSRTTKSQPSRNSRRNEGAAGADRVATGSSAGASCFGSRMRETNAAEARNDSASASTAIGAPSTWTSAPPSAGPATYATDWLALSRLLAAIYDSCGTSRAKKAVYVVLNTSEGSGSVGAGIAASSLIVVGRFGQEIAQ